MKETSLVIFTLLAQLAAGLFWILAVVYAWAVRQAGPAAAQPLARDGLLVIVLALGIGLLASFFHLGAPRNAWRTLSNLRQSWLSREILFAMLFAGAILALGMLQWFAWSTPFWRGFFAALAGVSSLGLVVAMSNAYRLRTVPAWNTWVTPASFFVTALLLGALACALLLIGPGQAQTAWGLLAVQRVALWAVLLLGAGLALFALWLAQMHGSQAAAASFLHIQRRHPILLRLRLVFAVAGLLAASAILLGPGQANLLQQGAAAILAFGLALLAEACGRLLFYAARVRHGV
jgi:anaerobic dimethyl sulfoxide reductase subunit C (anchor subunit)